MTVSKVVGTAPILDRVHMEGLVHLVMLVHQENMNVIVYVNLVRRGNIKTRKVESNVSCVQRASIPMDIRSKEHVRIARLANINQIRVMHSAKTAQ